ncbi:arylesterase [Desulfopila aestuarii]|uniref:Acyl-CoA thioesterase-1 n=1 Tax=Desulfopila aestuarii DSM 18488 TaxID=1121416 RepID=A0A1M7Y6D2_9BACT|nr:arylesterase [Desulfopila aestuarii]SHO48002.1 acyl-CoA thioesterase-1 [Desulfopila aestuarii DSM 18488]
MNRSYLRNNRVVTLLLLVLLLLVTGCDRQEEKQQPVTAKVEEQSEPLGTIVCVGDSLTAGLGVEEELSYPAQLERRLRVDGLNYQVVNAGVSGETTSGTLSRLEWILTMKPDIVILEIGANDGLRGIDPAVPAKNLREILRVLKENDIIVVFTGMKMVWNLGPAYTLAFNGIYPEIADENDLIFMPFFLEDVATKRDLNIEDGLHPNAKGYEKVVDNLYPYVLKAIKQFEKSRAGS